MYVIDGQDSQLHTQRTVKITERKDSWQADLDSASGPGAKAATAAKPSACPLAAYGIAALTFPLGLG